MPDAAVADTLPYNPGSAIGMALEIRRKRAGVRCKVECAAAHMLGDVKNYPYERRACHQRPDATAASSPRTPTRSIARSECTATPPPSPPPPPPPSASPPPHPPPRFKRQQSRHYTKSVLDFVAESATPLTLSKGHKFRFQCWGVGPTCVLFVKPFLLVFYDLCRARRRL